MDAKKVCVFVNYAIEEFGIEQGVNWVKADNKFQDNEIVFYEKNEVGEFGIYKDVRNESDSFSRLLTAVAKGMTTNLNPSAYPHLENV